VPIPAILVRKFRRGNITGTISIPFHALSFQYVAFLRAPVSALECLALAVSTDGCVEPTHSPDLYVNERAAQIAFVRTEFFACVQIARRLMRNLDALNNFVSRNG